MENPRLVREQAREQACEWLSRLDAGVTTTERRVLDEWLEEHPVHLEEFMKMAEFWDEAMELSELSQVIPLEKFSTGQNRNQVRRMMLFSACAAATGLVAVVSLSKLGLLSHLPGMDSAVNLQARYETAIGEQATVLLPDNSKLILNTNSKVNVEFKDGWRNIVLLQGESHFEVERDVDRPFRVFVGGRVVEAVGTAFSVQKMEDDTVSVLVTEGNVNFSRFRSSAGDESLDLVDRLDFSISDVIPLAAGEYALAQNAHTVGIEKTLMEPEEIEARLAWRQGMLQFKGEPLGKVIEEISRYTTIVIEAEPNITDIEVEGFFRAQDIEGILRALHNNFKITIQRVNEGHIILASSE